MNTKSKMILIVTVLVLLIIFIFNIGRMLVEDEPPVSADAIVVLMGSIPDRILHAVDLYEQGYADKILIAEEFHSELLDEHSIETMVGAEINRLIAIELGVPPEVCIIIDGNTRSTQDEAMAFKEYFNDKEQGRILLVTSIYHSKRSDTIFEKALSNIEVVSSPTPYDTYNSSQWYKSREDASNVLLECLKFLNFYLIDQFKL